MITSEIIESFLKCAHKAYLLFLHEHGTKSDYELLEEELASHYKAQFYLGLQTRYNEQHFLQSLTFKKKRIFTEPSYMLHPVFRTNEVNITFDAIELLPQKNAFTSCSYLPIVVSPKEKVSKGEKLSLAVKCLLASRQWKFSAISGKIVYGHNLRTTKIRLSTYEKEAKQVLKNLKKILNNQDVPRHFKTDQCKICEFQKRCQATLLEKDDLSLLSGMNPTKVLKMNNRGIFSILQFSYTFRPRKRNKKTTKTSLRYEPALKALALRDKRTFIQEIPKLLNTEIDVYMDFEGLPDENFTYLIGLIVKHRESETHHSFWADSEKDEERIFQQLFATIAHFKDYAVYHYGSYELQSLKKFNKKSNNAYENELNLLLEHSVNILPFFSSAIYPPTYTNKLKDIAGFLKFRWSENDASGIQSIVWRKRWELGHDAEYKKVLIQYNIEDCLALKVIINWIESIERQCELPEKDTLAKVQDVFEPQYKWGIKNYQLDDFKEITKWAYFDYQRTKIYLKTNRQIEKAVEHVKKQHQKKVNVIDKIIVLRLTQCPHCGYDKLQHGSGARTIIDLKFMQNGIKKWVVKYRRTRITCLRYEKTFTAANLEKPYKHGNNLVIWTLNQHIVYNMSFRKIEKMLIESFGISCPTEVRRFRQRLAHEYQATIEEIQHKVIHGPLLHADETTAKVRGFSSPYVWVFTNMDSVFYVFKPTREAGFLKELLQGFAGVLVSDFYSGYDSLPCPQQKCLPHLIRDLNDDLLKHQFDLEFKEMVIRFGKLVRKIIETVNQYGLKKRHLAKHNKDVKKFYRYVFQQEYESSVAGSYQERLEKYQEKLFTFLNYDGIPWNNNNAEAAIKPFAEYRVKASVPLSETGLQEYLTLLSIQQTCRYRGLNFLEFLKSKEKSIDMYTKKVKW